MKSKGDWKMDVYIAAPSSVYKGNVDLLIPHSVNILESFVSIADFELPLIKGRKFMLDSGAFTFMGVKKNKAINWEEYLEKYADFITRNDVKQFYELDIDSVIGYENTLKLRDKLELITQKSVSLSGIRAGGLQSSKKCVTNTIMLLLVG